MDGSVISCQNMPSRERPLLRIDQEELQKSFWKPIKLSHKRAQKGELAKASGEMWYRSWNEPCQPYPMHNPTAGSSPLVCSIPNKHAVNPVSRSGKVRWLERKAISGRIFTLCVSIIVVSSLVCEETHFWRGKKMTCRFLLFCITPNGSIGME